MVHSDCERCRADGLPRRGFIGAVGASLLTLTIPCCGSRSLAVTPWTGPPPTLTDPRMTALSYAVLAPSSHNTQPWSVELEGAGNVVLWADVARSTPEVDPDARQLLVSQGTFIEAFVLGASLSGRSCEVELFPEGDWGGRPDFTAPVARLTLGEELDAPDPLGALLLVRQTNRRAYRDAPLPSEAVADLAATARFTSLRLITSETIIQKLAELCGASMAVEVSSRARSAELSTWFRLSSAEEACARDGLSLAGSGMSGLTRWAAETFFISRSDIEEPDSSFNEQAVSMAREQAATAAAFGVTMTLGQNPGRDAVQAGRDYLRLSLVAAKHGIAIHPMSQPIETYPEMASINAQLRRALDLSDRMVPQMLFRLGYAEAVPPSPRREMSSLVRAGGSPAERHCGRKPGQEVQVDERS